MYNFSVAFYYKIPQGENIYKVPSLSAVNKVTENKISCQTGKEGSMMTCAGSVISTSEQAGKKLKISVIAYIDNKEVNRLEKEYITKGSTLVENFSVSTTSVE